LRRPSTQSINAAGDGASGMPPSGSARRLEAGVQGGSQPGAGQGPPQGLSAEALHSMYHQCLKLAAENKITQKNTWDLSIVMDQARRTHCTHAVPAGPRGLPVGPVSSPSLFVSLLWVTGLSRLSRAGALSQGVGGPSGGCAADAQMSDLVKPSADERDTNFQRASMTLDAGVKIYATRVDSVHTATYQVLTGLSRAAPAPAAAAGAPAHRAARRPPQRPARMGRSTAARPAAPRAARARSTPLCAADGWKAPRT